MDSTDSKPSQVGEEVALRPPRRWFQFRLRTLLFAVGACALAAFLWRTFKDERPLAAEEARGALLKALQAKQGRDKALFGGDGAAVFDAITSQESVAACERSAIQRYDDNIVFVDRWTIDLRARTFQTAHSWAGGRVTYIVHGSFERDQSGTLKVVWKGSDYACSR